MDEADGADIEDVEGAPAAPRLAPGPNTPPRALAAPIAATRSHHRLRRQILNSPTAGEQVNLLDWLTCWLLLLRGAQDITTNVVAIDCDNHM